VLFRKSKLRETDAASYRNQDPGRFFALDDLAMALKLILLMLLTAYSGPLPPLQSTFVPDSWENVDKVSIQLLTLDAWGLVRTDLTGFMPRISNSHVPTMEMTWMDPYFAVLTSGVS